MTDQKNIQIGTHGEQYVNWMSNPFLTMIGGFGAVESNMEDVHTFNQQEDKIKIEKGTVQETLIVPLFARKMCTDTFPEMYFDLTASEICSRLDYDFSQLEKLYKKTVYEFGALEAAMRQLDMMWEINDYINDHPDASIVCMGCGLDFDARRCGTQRNHIFNIDFPPGLQTM